MTEVKNPGLSLFLWRGRGEAQGQASCLQPRHSAHPPAGCTRALPESSLPFSFAESQAP